MTTLEKYKRDYELTKEIGCNRSWNKYEWAAYYIFGIYASESEIEKAYVENIIDVCKAILEKSVNRYIEDYSNNINYCWVCQKLRDMDWIEWGNSIYDVWFDPDEYTHILCSLNEDDVDVLFSEENLRILIDFIESDD